MLAMWRIFLSEVFDLVFPRFCAGCGRRLAVAEDGICGKCLADIPTVSAADMNGDYVERMFWGVIPIERATSVFMFNCSETRSIIHTFKYSPRPTLAFRCGALMAQHLCEEGFFDGVDALIPVPLHKSRFRHRGYNQSQMLARGISECTGIPVWDDVVVRGVDNISQTHMTRPGRKENVQGIFQCVSPERLVGKHVMIVDDVITTGATIVSLVNSMLVAHGCSAGDVNVTSPFKVSVVSFALASSQIALGVCDDPFML